jgi:antitoxin (DNA-binding transcriptional repressor) of toxin-antitoxin stability system
MATVHISEVEAARDFAGLLAKVRAGVEVVIESDSNPVAVLRVPAPSRRSIEECIALLPAGSKAIIDEDFAGDVASAVAAHREPLNPPAWDRFRGPDTRFQCPDRPGKKREERPASPQRNCVACCGRGYCAVGDNFGRTGARSGSRQYASKASSPKPVSSRDNDCCSGGCGIDSNRSAGRQN